MEITVRKGTQNDVSALLRLVQELADYEKAPDEVEVTEAQLIQDGFGSNPQFQFFVAQEENRHICGVAFYYNRYSTWKGPTVYLEDLVVEESKRRLGVGKQLFMAVVEEAQRQGVKRMEWQVLDWNEPAIQFYKKVNATLDETWINCTFTEKQLKAL